MRDRDDIRVPGTVGAADVLAAVARLGAGEEDLALAAVPADALPGLPVVEVLAAGLGGPLEHDGLGGRVPVGDDGGLLGALLDDGRALLAALLLLGLGALRGHARALLAARVLALGALLAQAERGAAEVALAVHAHPDGLLHAEGVALGRVPLAGLQLQAVHLAELLRTLGKELGPRDLGGLNGRRDLGGGGGGGDDGSSSSSIIGGRGGLAASWG